MAGTAGSGGLSALTIGGITAAAVVAGGVAAYLFGFTGEDDTPQPVAQTSASANSEAAPVESAEAPAAANPAPVITPEPEAPEPVATEPVATEDAQVENPVPAVSEEVLAEDPPTESAPDTVAGDVSGPVETEQDTAPSDIDAATAAPVAEPGQDAESLTEETSSKSAEETADMVAAAVGEAAVPQTSTTQETSLVLAPPQLDTVRVEPDGNGLIAGRAQPGAEVLILLDNEVLDRFSVDAGGEFVTFVVVPPSTEQRVLSLQASFEGETASSDASFILGPIGRPVAVAEADTSAPDDAVGEITEQGSEGDAPAQLSTRTEAVQEETVPVSTAADQEGSVVVAEAPSGETSEPQSPAPVDASEPEAPDAVAVLRADSSGIKVIQPGDGDSAASVALDTLSYTESGDVKVAGRSQSSATLRVYLDNQAVADLRSGADGNWTASLGGIAPGNYTLRVDEITAQGIVLSRVEAPVSREAPEVLAEAVPEPDPSAPEPLLRAITVRKGDSLWAISRKAYGDGRLYVRLFDANRNEIKDPDLIFPGQVFALPE